MKNFEFKSQVATTREQSERLLALGLKKETADMHWCYHSVTATWYVVTHPYDEIGDWLPAWSLHRLLIMYRDNYSFFSLDNAYDELIDAIAIDVEKGTFKKDYLEERK